MLPEGLYAQLFLSNDYSGPVTEVYGSFEDESVGMMTCQNLKTQGHYQTARIDSNLAKPPTGDARGSWHFIDLTYSGEELTLDMHVGLSIQYDDESRTQNAKETLSADGASGVEMFDPYTGDVTLTSSAAATVVQDYEKYYDADFSQAITITCPPVANYGYNALN